MSWLTRTRWMLFGAFVLALAVGGGPFVEWRCPQFVDRSPVTANIVAGAMLVPLELYVAGVLLTGVQNLRRRRQWQVAAAELTDAVGATWARLRDLLVYQYSVDDVTGPLSRIRDAREVWEHLHRQEAARAGHDLWADRPDWQVQDGATEAISRVALLWMFMWPAGLHHDWKLLHRKLTRVLVPRLSADNPDMVSTGRQLVDAIGDLHDLVDELLRQEDPFELPASLEDVDPANSDQTLHTETADGWAIWIADGEPEQRMRNLDDLASAYVIARQVIEQGDRLMALLHAADPRRHRPASRIRPARLDEPSRTAFDATEESWTPPLPRSEQVDSAVPADAG